MSEGRREGTTPTPWRRRGAAGRAGRARAESVSGPRPGGWTEAPWVNVGVLTLSTPAEGGYYTDSGPMSTRRQAKYTSPRKLGFGVLGLSPR